MGEQTGSNHGEANLDEMGKQLGSCDVHPAGGLLTTSKKVPMSSAMK